MKKVLVVEDRKEIRQFIVISLRRAGFQVIEAETGEEALKVFKKEKEIDIIVLDIMLPGIDGFEVCKSIRKKNKYIGIIMLTAKMQEKDKINGLSIGADDYVVKPFSPSELIARIKSVCRRVDMIKGDNGQEITSGPFKINTLEHRLLKNNKIIELTEIEYLLMKLFLENPNRALDRNYILDEVWGENYFGSLKVVDVNIRRLRQKIEDNPSEPKYIETVWGYGYRWEKDE